MLYKNKNVLDFLKSKTFLFDIFGKRLYTVSVNKIRKELDIL